MTASRLRGLRISLASPEQIRAWSSGEVTRPETIQYRTQKPVPDGLFCERIFGPTRDWSCACGKYQRERRAGFVCETCGVELAPWTVRRERMGHIELAAPVVHPWYLRSRIIGVLLGLSPRTLSAVLTAQRYLVLSVDDQGRTSTLAHPQEDETDATARELLIRVQPGDLLDGMQYWSLSLWFPTAFHAQTGAEAIHHLLEALDLDHLATHLRQEIDQPGNRQNKTIIKRLQIVEAFRASGQNPAWMVLSVLPVLPPELRPIVPVAGGRFATSDVNELYCRVLHRNHRLKHLLEQGAPDLIVKHECRLLQEACHALLDTAHTSKLTGAHKHPLKSLTDHLQGKHGLFRYHLLGKRVDYSGRSVIVAGPTLHLQECGLPKDMACELFKPFLIRKLLNRHLAQTPRAAKRMVERRDRAIWDLLAEVLYERVVLLNRAPTLHRLSIQAFYPHLIEGKAIQLHPLVCSAFNADFDGDQMAVHVPLSPRARQEAIQRLLSTHNLLHPASGEPCVSPSQEIVLGCFYLTEDRPSAKRAGRIFADGDEARLAYDAGFLDLHTPIIVRLDATHCYQEPPPVPLTLLPRRRVETTVGRILFNDLLPGALHYRNYAMTKERLKALVAESLTTCGEESTVQLLDALKRLGYHYATTSGISFALSDIRMPPQREELIAQGHRRVQEVDEVYHTGEITDEERYRMVIDIWTQITEQISAQLNEVLDPFGTIMTIVKSGATKAKFQQIRQLSGIRGLMASPSGKILPIPVLSNYLLGLLVWEIFIAASGARKGFMDRSLNTAMSGYLTRRLVEAGMEVVITCQDCETIEGIWLTAEQSGLLGLPLRTRLLGRVLAEPTGTLAAGTLLDAAHIDALVAAGTQQVYVRSPLTCQASYGICQQCYGTDLATGTLVALRTAVGVIAGQSIGEPGTQLTMRTFHAGGIANNASDITLGLPRLNELFEGRIPTSPAVLTKAAGIIQAIEKGADSAGVRIQVVGRDQQERTYQLPPGKKPLVQVGQAVEAGTALHEGPLNPHALVALRGSSALAQYLITQVEHIYRATGVSLHEKHLETIVRQLLRYVRVVAVGDTELLPGDVLDRFTFQERCAAILAQGGRPAFATPLLLGLTQAILHTGSWVAAASFQDTSRVLATAAIRGQTDDLLGLKERLIAGETLLLASTS